MTEFQWHQKVAYDFYQARVRIGMPPDPLADWYLAECILVLVPNENTLHWMLRAVEYHELCVRSPEYLRALVKHTLETRESNARSAARSTHAAPRIRRHGAYPSPSPVE